MFNIALFEPEIPPNTGNIMRLCTNTGFSLHLIEPLGFSLEEKQLRRAGLDYRDMANVSRWSSLDQYLEQHKQPLFAFTTKGSKRFDTVSYTPGDTLLFGPETRGLPSSVLQRLAADQKVVLPMQPDSRSLNLSNVVAIASYEAWRQNDFAH
ncbi:MAG: tRNA (cytidine(34)-2'-O)-methyltransferase [Pseudomonadota bacterium]